jgi:predicted tellurium resistance membrane protein TerC
MDKIEINAATKLSIVIASAFSASLIILFGFACLSDFTNDWTWFSRSGSILVAIGVSVTAYDIKVKWKCLTLQESMYHKLLFLKQLF